MVLLTGLACIGWLARLSLLCFACHVCLNYLALFALFAFLACLPCLAVCFLHAVLVFHVVLALLASWLAGWPT